MYRGNLKDGRTVAIKRMKTEGGPDAEHVFLTEVLNLFIIQNISNNLIITPPFAFRYN